MFLAAIGEPGPSADGTTRRAGTPPSPRRLIPWIHPPLFDRHLPPPIAGLQPWPLGDSDRKEICRGPSPTQAWWWAASDWSWYSDDANGTSRSESPSRSAADTSAAPRASGRTCRVANRRPRGSRTKRRRGEHVQVPIAVQVGGGSDLVFDLGHEVSWRERHPALERVATVRARVTVVRAGDTEASAGGNRHPG